MEAAVSVEKGCSGRCQTPGCNAPAQPCIDGLSPEECPNFIISAEPEEALKNAATAGTEATAKVGRGGEALSITEADACMLSVSATCDLKLVSLVGVPESGKTTLLASLYEIIRRGFATDICFAGSETIRGFEERCHLSRIASMRPSPDTPHTAMELRLLHLRVVKEQTGGRGELFFADRRGEQFQALLDRPILSDTFPEVKRGDSVAFLLDGEHLVDGSKREAAISQVRRLALALKDIIGQSRGVQLVVTKNDVIEGHADEALIRSRISALSSQLSNAFGQGTHYTAHSVTARRLEDPCNGLHVLLSEWMRPRPNAARQVPPPPLGNNAFERLMNI